MDTTFSMRPNADNRWNSPSFPALYCCCSEDVAGARVRDSLRRAAVLPEDLQPARVPTLVEVSWEGTVVDCASAEGIRAAGLPAQYPESADRATCRQLGENWHEEAREGVLCRSAAIWRIGRGTAWRGPHEPWGEVAIYVRNASRVPSQRRRRSDLRWIADAALREALIRAADAGSSPR